MNFCVFMYLEPYFWLHCNNVAHSQRLVVEVCKYQLQHFHERARPFMKKLPSLVAGASFVQEIILHLHREKVKLYQRPFWQGCHLKNVRYIFLIAQQCRVKLALLNHCYVRPRLHTCKSAYLQICIPAKTSRSLTKGVGDTAVDLGLNLGPALIWKSCMCSYPSILL